MNTVAAAIERQPFTWVLKKNKKVYRDAPDTKGGNGGEQRELYEFFFILQHSQ